MSKFKLVKPVIPVAPGETLAEFLESTGMTQAELAIRLGRPLKFVNEIVRGKAAITAETALQLEKVFNTPASFWNNLESIYRELLARDEAQGMLGSEIAEAKKYPIKEMVSYGWIQKPKNPQELVENLLTFFGVTSLRNIVEKEKILDNVQYRIARTSRYSLHAITSWLRKGVQESQAAVIEDFNEDRIERCIQHLRVITTHNITEGQIELRKALADCGVAIIFTPHLPGAPINGVSRWLTPTKALIQLSLRYKYSDIFWFNIFHELGHLILHSKKTYNIDFSDNKMPDDDGEKEADLFAADSLIPPNDYSQLLSEMENKGHTASLITSFANSLEINKGIVVGRLQHDRIVNRFQYNSLRSQFTFVKD